MNTKKTIMIKLLLVVLFTSCTQHRLRVNEASDFEITGFISESTGSCYLGWYNDGTIPQIFACVPCDSLKKLTTFKIK